MKITQSEPQNNEEDRGTINAIKTDMSADGSPQKKEDVNVMEQQKDKDNDNASSASTVEVLDDK